MQSQFAGALPDPSGNYTLFAPTDNAFFSLLTTYSESCQSSGSFGAYRRAAVPCIFFDLRPPSHLCSRSASTHLNSPFLSLTRSLPPSPDLSITDALALGDRLTSVLLYHVAVGALTPDQLAKGEQ